MNVLVLCPMEVERKNFIKSLSNYSQHMTCSNKYTVKQIGIGKCSAASETSLLVFDPQHKESFDLVVLVGYAAGSTYFSQGDFVIPMQARYHDVEVPEDLCPELTKVYSLHGVDDITILTGDSFITKEKSLQLTNKYGDKVIFDMEATSVSQVLDDTSIPFMVLKIISDVPEDPDSSFGEFIKAHTDFTQFISYIESLED